MKEPIERKMYLPQPLQSISSIQVIAYNPIKPRLFLLHRLILRESFVKDCKILSIPDREPGILTHWIEHNMPRRAPQHHIYYRFSPTSIF